MATLSKALQSTEASSRLRPYDVWRDLNAVADLIELCFTDSLDVEGRRYLDQMRSAARSPSYLRWASLTRERTTLPLSGYVWEQDGLVVGNLTLIPYYQPRRRYFLIANVAVHPDYRRQGIAARLTQRAIESAQQHGAQAAWLQVRDDNEGAVRLYHSLGFSERARRTTWICNDPAGLDSTLDPEVTFRSAAPSGMQVGLRLDRDWPAQKAWLRANYPPELAWHMTLRLHALQPGLFGYFYRMWNDIYVQQWSAWRSGRLLGVMSWQSLAAFTDNLWLAAGHEADDQALTALLLYARKKLPARRSTSLDYPAGRATQAFQAAGFQEAQTLIWMSLDTH
jgi:ribosomal protein S18 acetylase RimI-like enzyme